MHDWYGTEQAIREWMDKPMTTITTIIAGILVVFIFYLMIYLSI